MKNKNIIIGVAGIAILGCGIFLGSTLKNGGDSASKDATGTDGKATVADGASSAAVATAADPKADKSSKPRPESAWAKLTEKYGDGRTKLSKKVTEDISKVMDDAVELADMGSQLAGGKSASEMTATQAVNSLSSQLGLTDEQKAKATEIVTKRVNERMDAMKELSSAMRDDPSAMMETILAGDAFSRGDISEEEYNEASEDTLGLLKNVAGFGFGGPGGGGGSQLADPALASELQKMLTPEQQTQLADLVAKAQEKSAQTGPGKLPFQNGSLPPMDLEKLDQSIQSAQKLTGGIRAMMEGLKGLQQLNPPATGN
jgi:hypothetical protein